MSMEELETACRLAITRDREWLVKIEPAIQKAAQSADPHDKKRVAPLRGLKKTLLKSIKIHERVLAQIAKANKKPSGKETKG